METFLTVIYVIITVVMIIVILMQSSKGGMGAIGGGSSTGSLFGGGGAESFLNKTTAILGVAFVLLAIILVQFSSHKVSSLSGKNAGTSTSSTSTMKANGEGTAPTKEKASQNKDAQKKGNSSEKQPTKK